MDILLLYWYIHITYAETWATTILLVPCLLSLEIWKASRSCKFCFYLPNIIILEVWFDLLFLLPVICLSTIYLELYLLILDFCRTLFHCKLTIKVLCSQQSTAEYILDSVFISKDFRFAWIYNRILNDNDLHGKIPEQLTNCFSLTSLWVYPSITSP